MIADNILLAQELTNCLGKGGNLNNTILKLDMEKAYDCMNWNFLYCMLAKFGFPEQWISLVKRLIENCWFNILINGEGAGFFKSSRGLRQGDPISPPLFVIAAECLSRSLDSLFIQYPRLRFFSRSNTSISHLAFADDVIIFCKRTRKDLNTLMEFLKKYESISGQRINKSKSFFTVDRKTSNLRIQCIQQATGFHLKFLPTIYLGAPLFKCNKKSVVEISKSELVMVTLYYDKYCKGSHPLTATLPYFASPNWKRLWRVRNDADVQCFWSLGTGKISFWFDNWVGEHALCRSVPEQLCSFATVSFFWSDNKWDFSKLCQVLPLNLAQQISQIPFDPTSADLIHWKLSSNGHFSTKLIWNQIRSTKTTLQLLREI
ncbi:UNVERIFIED_CONTAM: putative mitochondrial protein [Sesamum radiatum]|uniref:Mitochondrial protein n=1 Tax=Sesamum radiatum TaxID=300843 RepID=A0AAW2KR68_SESRA